MYSFTNLSPGRGKQHQTLDVGLTLQSGQRVRVTIDHDTSYANQSYAKAEVWSQTDLRWNLAETYHYAQWANDTMREDPDGPTAGIDAAYEELIARVEALLA